MHYKSYVVKDSATDLAVAKAVCNGMCFSISFPQMRTSLVNEYGDLLKRLIQLDNLELVQVKALCSQKSEKVRLAIRHDVDHDIVCAELMCQIEMNIGLSASYYLHHASPYYYGSFHEDGTFIRNSKLLDLYLRMQEQGAEIGLHVDPFSVYRKGISGAQAVIEELNWLRDGGLDVCGTTAHGSAPYYGAENFEIFRERHLSIVDSVNIDGMNVELGQLCEEELGIKYEGNFARKRIDVSPERVSEYLSTTNEDDLEKQLQLYLGNNPLFSWGYDFTLWLYGRDAWCIATHEEDSRFEYGVGTKRIIQFLQDLNCPKSGVLHIHPCYYGLRLNRQTEPVFRKEDDYQMHLIYSVIDEIVKVSSEFEGKKAELLSLEQRIASVEDKIGKIVQHPLGRIAKKLLLGRK